MVGEADKGKTIQNIVKMSVSGCIISVRNKCLVKLPVLPASLPKVWQSVCAQSLKVSSL